MPIFPLQHRPLIISIAYSILGSYSDAEDVAQDIAEKWLKLEQDTIKNKKNYLIRLTINHCLNAQKQQQRLQYKGQWLPEPVLGDLLANEQVFELKDLLTYELVTQLSRLTPYERSVFILKEAFDFNHQEIAQIIDKTSDNSRQMLSRAKAKIRQTALPSVVSEDDKTKAIQFAQYIQQGELEQLIALFQSDIQVFSDGGGKVFAAAIPVTGAEKVAKFYLKIAENAPEGSRATYAIVLGQPALLLYQANQLTGAIILNLHQGKIQTIYSVLNPDKLSHLVQGLPNS